MAFTADPTLVGQASDAMNQKAMMAYYNAKLQGDSDNLAFQKAQAAVALYGNLTSAFGFSAGNPYNPQSVPYGTPTMSATQALGYLGYIPGYTGVAAGQTPGLLAQQAGTAQSAAGLTGWYAAPAQSRFSPGTFVRMDPNTYDTSQYGDTQISYVLPTGQLQRVSIPQAKAMGWNGDLSSMNTASSQEMLRLEGAPPQNLPQQTLEGMTQYSNLNAGAVNQALAQAGATGMYTAPATVRPPGTDLQGNKFSDLPPETQQAYFQSRGSDWNAAMQGWVNDSNANIRQFYAANGLQIPGEAGAPQETMEAQNQYFTQAQALAAMYGQYYAPGTPGQAGTAGVNGPQQGQLTSAQQEQNYTQWLRSQQEARAQWEAQQTASQNYLGLMAGLRGPADWAQYQKVLGATPQGTKDLVAAAAGQYIPGGGATTGVQPQSVSLGNFVGGLTGQGGTSQQDQAAMGSLVAPNQMAPQTWNALSPSQQQMLLGVWEGQGYSKDDAANLFKQSLPKYATNAPAGGSFRLQ